MKRMVQMYIVENRKFKVLAKQKRPLDDIVFNKILSSCLPFHEDFVIFTAQLGIDNDVAAIEIEDTKQDSSSSSDLIMSESSASELELMYEVNPKYDEVFVFSDLQSFSLFTQLATYFWNFSTDEEMSKKLPILAEQFLEAYRISRKKNSVVPLVELVDFFVQSKASRSCQCILYFLGIIAQAQPAIVLEESSVLNWIKMIKTSPLVQSTQTEKWKFYCFGLSLILSIDMTTSDKHILKQIYKYTDKEYLNIIEALFTYFKNNKKVIEKEEYNQLDERIKNIKDKTADILREKMVILSSSIVVMVENMIEQNVKEFQRGKKLLVQQKIDENIEIYLGFHELTLKSAKRMLYELDQGQKVIKDIFRKHIPFQECFKSLFKEYKSIRNEDFKDIIDIFKCSSFSLFCDLSPLNFIEKALSNPRIHMDRIAEFLNKFSLREHRKKFMKKHIEGIIKNTKEKDLFSVLSAQLESLQPLMLDVEYISSFLHRIKKKYRDDLLNFVKQIENSSDTVTANIVNWICTKIVEPKLKKHEYLILEQLNSIKVDNAICRRLYEEGCQIFNSENIIWDYYDSFLTNDFKAIEIVVQCNNLTFISETIKYVLAFDKKIQDKTVNLKIVSTIFSSPLELLERLKLITERCYMLQNIPISHNVLENILSIKNIYKNFKESEVLFRNFFSFNNILGKAQNMEMREKFSHFFSVDQYSLTLNTWLENYNNSPLKKMEEAIQQWARYRRLGCFEMILEKLKQSNETLDWDKAGIIIFEAKRILLNKCNKILKLIPENEIYMKTINFIFGRSTNISKEVSELKEIMAEEHCESFEDSKWIFLISLLNLMKKQKVIYHQIEVILFTKKYINLRNEEFYSEIQKYSNFLMDSEQAAKQNIKSYYKNCNDISNLIKKNLTIKHKEVLSFLISLFNNSELVDFVLDKLSETVLSQAEEQFTTLEKPGITFNIIQTIQKVILFHSKIQKLTIQQEVLEETDRFIFNNKEDLHLCFKESKSIMDELKNLLNNEIEPVKTNFLSMKQILLNSKTIFEQDSCKWNFYCIFDTITGKESQNQGSLLRLSKKAFLFINLSKKSVGKREEDNLNKCLKYYEFKNKLTKINEILHDLSSLSCQIKETKFIVECQSEKYPQAQELIDKLEALLEKWQHKMRYTYVNNTALTYYTPYQLKILKDYFFKNKNSSEIIPLLEYAGIPSTSLSQLSSEITLEVTNEIKDKYHNKASQLNLLGEKLKELIASRLALKLKTSKPQIYKYEIEKLQYKKQNEADSTFLFSTTVKIDIVKYLFLIHRKMPEYRQLLFCSEETKWQEVFSFTYRCLYNQTESYTMLFPERLSYENQKRMKEELLLPLNKTKLSTMPINIVFSNRKSLILQFFLEKEEIIKNLLDFCDDGHELIADSVKSFMGPRFSECKILVSEGPGQGKTTFIKSENKNVVWISIAGIISFSSFAQQLKKGIQEITIFKGEATLAFQIHQVLNLETLEIVMLQLFLYNTLLNGNEIITIPKQCSIVIEIQNTVSRPLLCMKYFYHGAVGNVYSGGLKGEKNKLKLVCTFLSLYQEKTLQSQLPLDLSSIRPLDNEVVMHHIIKYFWCEKSFLKADHSLQSTSRTLIQLKIFIHFMERQIRFFNNIKLDPEKTDSAKLPINLIFELLLNTAQNITSSNYISKLEIKQEMKHFYTYEEKKSFGLGYERLKKSLAFFTPKGEFAYVYDKVHKHPNCNQLESYSWFEHHYSCNDLISEDYYNILSKLFVILTDRRKTDYVLTKDNFFKIIYIYMRVNANIPVVLIGETGCGKTYTIRYMCEHLKLGEPCPINIHSGLSAKNIIDQVLEICKKAINHCSKQFWVFFDELNTNENIGVISSMMSDRMIEGKRVPKNIRFMAACNPFRLAKPNETSLIGFAPREDPSHKLEYRVFPLPETLTEYSWDIGEVDEESGKRYIEEIVKRLMAELKINNVKEERKILEMLINSHNFFIKNKDEKHLVSFRDLQRFRILYKFFYKLSTDEMRAVTSAILACLFCYHYRIASQVRRGSYISILSNAVFAEYSIDKIKTLIKNTQEMYLKDIKLPSGIVWTESLREIVFVMIVCIQTRIPLLVVGKPGCSKSLALKIIAQNCKGSASETAFLRQFDKFVFYICQGTNNTTSEEVDNIFERAIGGSKNSPQVTTVVVIEEIGLAELSNKNPLKVLHSRLDLQRDGIQQVAFIALSNWALDAAKMNRTLVLSRLPPTEMELIEIGEQFSKYYNLSPASTTYIDYLVKAYWKFYKTIDCNSINVKESDKYGMRDFFSLIVEACIKMPNSLLEENKLRCLKYLISKNLGIVHLSSFPSLWMNFYSQINLKDVIENFPDYTELNIVKKILKHSQDNFHQRYLLLVGENACLQFSQETCFNEEISNMKIIVGSQYPNDQNNQEYIEKILSTIIFCMDNGIPVIMINMANFYCYLYDLFNQLCSQTYCRIALSSGYHPLIRVDSKFMCMVYMSEAEFSIENPPLLNRFEKHIIKLYEHFENEEKEVYQNLQLWVESIGKQEYKNNLKSDMKPQNLFMNYSDLLVQIIVKQEYSNKKSKEGLFQNCKERMIQLGTMELAIVNSIGIPSIERTYIWDTYRKTKYKTLLEEISYYSTTSSENKIRWLVFTYLTEINTIINSSVYLLHFSTTTSEEFLNQEINTFFNSSQILLIVLVDYSSESKHLLHLAASIQEQQSDSKKNVFILVSTKRGKRKAIKTIYLQGYQMKAYDYLEMNIELIERLHKGRDDMIMQLIQNKFSRNYKHFLQKAVIMVDRETDEQDAFLEESSKKSERSIFNLIQLISEDDINILIEPFLVRIKEAFYHTKMIRRLMKFLSSMESLRFKSFEYTLDKFLNDNIESWMKYIVYCIEKHSALSSFFFCSGPREVIRTIWLQNFKNISMEWIEDLEQPIAGRRVNSYIPSLRFPFSKLVFDRVSNDAINEHSATQTASITINQILEKTSNKQALYSELMKDTLRIFLTQNQIAKKERYILLLVKMLLNKEEPRIQDDVSRASAFILIHSAKVINFMHIIKVYESMNSKNKVDISELNLKGSSSISENFSLFACKIITSIIEDVSPKKELIGKGSPSIYLDDLKEIMYLTPYIETNFMKYIPNYLLLMFWADFAQLMYDQPNSIEELISVTENLKYLENKYGCTSYEMLQSNEFYELIKKKLFYIHKSERYYKFINTYYSILLNKPCHIANIVGEMEEMKEGLPLLGRLIKKLFDHAKLGTILQESQTSNEYLKALNNGCGSLKFRLSEDQPLEKKCKSSCLEMILFYMMHHNKDKKFKESEKAFSDSIDQLMKKRSSLPPIIRMKSILIVRRILESAVETGFRSEELKTVLENHYKGNNSIDTTFRVFIYKLLSPEKQNSFAQKYCSYFTPDIISESIVKEMLPCIPGREEQFAFMLEVSQLFRHIKLVNFEGDQEIASYLAPIFEVMTESYDNQLGFVFATINEFYIIQKMQESNDKIFKYFYNSLEKWLQLEILDKGILQSTIPTPNTELREYIRKVMKNFEMDMSIFSICDNKCESVEFYLPIVLVSIVGIVICGRYVENPFTNLFFENGELDLKYPQKFSKKFVIGSQYWIHNDFLKGFQSFDPNEMEFGGKDNIEDNILNSLLSLMLCTMMAYFYKRVETTQDILKGDPTKILTVAIYKSFVYLITQIGEFTGLNHPQQHIILCYVLIGCIADFMKKGEISSEYSHIIKYQKFLTNILKTNLNKLAIEEYQIKLTKMNKELLNKEALLSEEISDPYLKYQYYFKIIEKPNFKKMMTIYEKKSDTGINQQMLYPITSILQLFSESDVKILELIYPLSQFIKRVHDKYLFKITKKEAENEELTIPKNEENQYIESLYKLFEDCRIAINKILKLNPPLNPTIEAISQIEPLFKEKKSTIINYIIDTSKERCKIKEALIKVCKIQNSFLKRFYEIPSKTCNQQSFKKISILSLTKEDVLTFEKITSYDSLASEKSWCCYPENTGMQLAYNFEFIDAYLLKELTKRKKISTKTIENFHFKNENLFDLDIIEDVKKWIFRRFPQCEEEKIGMRKFSDKFILEEDLDIEQSICKKIKEEIKEELSKNGREFVFEIFSRLIYLMHNILKTGNEVKPEHTIANYCKANISMINPPQFFEYSFKYLLYIFEQFEEESFSILEHEKNASRYERVEDEIRLILDNVHKKQIENLVVSATKRIFARSLLTSQNFKEVKLSKISWKTLVSYSQGVKHEESIKELNALFANTSITVEDGLNILESLTGIPLSFSQSLSLVHESKEENEDDGSEGSISLSEEADSLNGIPDF